jgi:integrase
MATIAKVPRARGVAYQAKIKRQGRLVKSKTFHNKAAAREWARRVEADLEQAIASGDPGHRTRFDALSDRYLAQYAGRDHHRRTQIRWWQDRLGGCRLADISLEVIRLHLDNYRFGRDRHPVVARTPASTNRLKAALSALFTFGVKHGLANKNPARQIPVETEHNHRIRFLSQEERMRLLQACRESTWDRLYLLVLMALMTGARKGELLTLRWEWVDVNERTVQLARTKNGESRVLTLPLPVVEELLRFRGADELVFPGRRGRNNRPADARPAWERALAQAGIQNFRFHDLRHSAASYLAMAGASLLEVAEVLGHRSVQTTKRYAHLSVAHKKSLTDRVLGNLEI